MKSLLASKKVLNVYEVTGDFDLLIEIIAKDIDDLRKFLTMDIFRIPGVKKTNTMIILKKYRRRSLPI